MRDNKILIIIHGAWRPHIKNNFLKYILSKILTPLTSQRGVKREDYKKLAKYLKNNYKKVKRLRWNGGIFRKTSILPAEKGLEKILNKYQNKKIDIISFSMGGLIAQEVLIKNKQIKINKFVLVGAIQNKKHIKNVKQIFNIYSNKDKMFSLANKLYTKNKYLKGKNIKKIIIKNLKHDDICQNINIDRKEKTLFELYKHLLLDDQKL